MFNKELTLECDKFLCVFKEEVAKQQKILKLCFEMMIIVTEFINMALHQGVSFLIQTLRLDV